MNNGALFYVTGGGAYGRVTETDGLVIGGAGAGGTVFNSVGTDLFGWAAGAGIEAALYGNWTGKVEYLYMDLGSIANSTNLIVSGAGGGTVGLTNSSAVRDHIIRAGLNYRIGPDASGMAYGSAGAAYGSARAEPAFAAAPIYSWTGFYFGGNLGYSVGNDRMLQGFTDPSGLTNLNGASSTAEGVISPHGVIGGGQLGYNWQGGANWLAGFEADFQGSNQSDATCTPGLCVNATGAAATEAITIEQELQFLATLRGRVGAVSNGVLVYATGGAAFGRVAETTSFNLTGGNAASATTTSDQVGWVVGGGMEVALWGGWSAKAEYLYVDLGSLSNTGSVTGVAGSSNVSVVTTSTIRDHIFRVGANYRFGAAPVVSRAY